MNGTHVAVASDWNVTKWEHFKYFLHNLFKRKKRTDKTNILSEKE